MYCHIVCCALCARLGSSGDVVVQHVQERLSNIDSWLLAQAVLLISIGAWYVPIGFSRWLQDSMIIPQAFPLLKTISLNVRMARLLFLKRYGLSLPAESLTFRAGGGLAEIE